MTAPSRTSRRLHPPPRARRRARNGTWGGARHFRAARPRCAGHRGPCWGAGGAALGADAFRRLAAARPPAILGGDPGRAARPDGRQLPAGRPRLRHLARVDHVRPRCRPLRHRDRPWHTSARSGRGRTATTNRSGTRGCSRAVRADLSRGRRTSRLAPSGVGHRASSSSPARSRGRSRHDQAGRPRAVGGSARVRRRDRRARLAVAAGGTHPRRRQPLAGDLHAQQGQTTTRRRHLHLAQPDLSRRADDLAR